MESIIIGIIGIGLGILITVVLWKSNVLKEFRYPRWVKWIFNLEGFRSQKKASTDKNTGGSANSSKSPGLIPQCILASFGSIQLVLLVGFLYFFYAGVLEKAFAPRMEQEINHFFDFTAVPRAFGVENPEQFPNFPVILFPSVFFVFAYVTHFFFGKAIRIAKMFVWFGGVVIFLFSFDFILAKKISENLTQAFEIRKAFLNMTSSEIPTLRQSESLNILGIIFLGFVSSLLLGVGLYCNLQDWGKASWLKKIKNLTELDPGEYPDRIELSDTLDS